jgi:hypothetical protein
MDVQYGEMLQESGILELQIVSSEPVDGLSCIGCCDGLIGLSVIAPMVGAVLDLGGLKSLTHLRVDSSRSGVNERIVGIASLENLSVYQRVAASKRALSELCELGMLQTVQMTMVGSGDGLESIGRLRRLRYLGLHGARNSETLECLRKCASLTHINLSCMRKMPSLSFLRDLRKLVWIGLRSCGDVDSLRWLTGLAELRVVIVDGSTRILDGDLRCLGNDRIERVQVRGRKSYHPAAAVVNRATAREFTIDVGWVHSEFDRQSTAN